MNDILARDFVPLEGNVCRRADGLVHHVWYVPGTWEGSYIILGAVGGNIYVLFGWSATIAANPAVYSGITPGPPDILVPNADSPDRVAENTVSRLWVPAAVRQGAPGKGGVATNSRVIQYFGIVGDNEDAEWFAYPVTEAKTE